MPVTLAPENVRPEPPEGRRIAVDHRHRVAPVFERPGQRCDPTRPQPMITMCTVVRCALAAGTTRARLPRSKRYTPRVSLVASSAVDVASAKTARCARAHSFAATQLARHPAAQAHRLAGLRLRRAVFGRVCAERNLPHAVARRLSRPTPSAGRSRSLVSLVMLVVVASYRQNVHAYPSRWRRLRGGHDQPRPQRRPDGGRALLVDYVLTVAVSISSAAQYAARRWPSLHGHEVDRAPSSRSS